MVAAFPVLASMVWAAASCTSSPEDETSPPPPSCKLPFQGDANAAPQIELIYSGADGLNHPVEEGGEIPMLLPPQGGRVVYVGARVTNMDPCQATLNGSVRDLDTDQVRLDIRTVNFTPTGDGWAQSAEGNPAVFSNVPLCPNQWSESDLFGASYLLTIKVTDRGGKVAEAQAHVRPSCVEPDNEADCKCICRGGYMLGDTCQGTTSTSASSTGSTGASGGSGS